MQRDIDSLFAIGSCSPAVTQARIVTTHRRTDRSPGATRFGHPADGSGRQAGRPRRTATTLISTICAIGPGGRESTKQFVLTAEQCAESDREFVQFYQRRVAWLSLRRVR